jgi:hypothetical protein
VDKQFYYRIRDGCFEGGRAYLYAESIPVLRETKKGVWIGYDEEGKRFVLNDARKRYACPTVEEALESLKARKHRQIRILQGQLENAKKNALECSMDSVRVAELLRSVSDGN